MTGRGVSAGGRWLSDQVLAMAPRLPVRSLATLRTQFPGRTPDELAEVLAKLPAGPAIDARGDARRRA